MQKTKARRWWIALILGIASRGLGQVYNGQPFKGLLFFFLPLALTMAAARSALPSLTRSRFLLYAAALVCAIALIDAVISAIRQRWEFSLRWYNKVYLYAVIALFSWALKLTVFDQMLVRNFAMSGEMMSPAIRAGERVLCDLTAYSTRNPKRGDIILFRSPLDRQTLLMKRILALSGETVAIRDKRVEISGREVDDPWAQHSDSKIIPTTSQSRRDQYGPVNIPPLQYFVLDDERDISYDSRYWDRFVPRELILGRAAAISWSWKPFSEIRWSRIGSRLDRPEGATVDRQVRAREGDPRMIDLEGIGYIILGIGLIIILFTLFAIWGWLTQDRESPEEAPFKVPETRRPPKEAPVVIRPEVPAFPAASKVAIQPSIPAETPLDDATADEAEAIHLNNLARGLHIAARRENDLEKLKRAVDTYGRALKKCDHSESAQYSKSIRNNLGLALLDKAREEKGTSSLEKAVSVFRHISFHDIEERVDQREAMYQNNLASALQALGQRQRTPNKLEEAASFYRLARRSLSRKTHPQQWATTNHNLGTCLQALAEQSKNPHHLSEALECYRNALEERGYEHSPEKWAESHNHLGIALQSLGRYWRNSQLVSESIKHHVKAWSALGEISSYKRKMVAAHLREALAHLTTIEGREVAEKSLREAAMTVASGA